MEFDTMEQAMELYDILGGKAEIQMYDGALDQAFADYLELPGASYDHMNDGQVNDLMNFCGRDNIDFVARVSRDTERELGCIRGKAKERN